MRFYIVFHSIAKAAYVCLFSTKPIAYELQLYLANIINSKLILFSSRFVAKVVLDGSSSTSSDGDSLSICVDLLRSLEVVLELVIALDLKLPVSCPFF